MINNTDDDNKGERYEPLNGYEIVDNSPKLFDDSIIEDAPDQLDTIIYAITNLNKDIQEAMNNIEELGDESSFFANISQPLNLILNSPFNGFIRFIVKGLNKDLEDMSELAENAELFKETAFPELAEKSKIEANLKMAKILKNPLVKPLVLIPFRIITTVIDDLLTLILGAAEGREDLQKKDWSKFYDEMINGWEKELKDRNNGIEQ